MTALSDWSALDAAPLTPTDAVAASHALRREAAALRLVTPPDGVERLIVRAEGFARLARRLAQQNRDKAVRIGRCA